MILRLLNESILLERKCNVNEEREEDGFTPLHFVGHHKSIDREDVRKRIAHELIFLHDVDTNVPSKMVTSDADDGQYTSLHLAVMNEHYGLAEALLRGRVDSSFNKSDDPAMALKFGGADPQRVTQKGKKASDLAKMEAMKSLLIRYTGEKSLPEGGAGSLSEDN